MTIVAPVAASGGREGTPPIVGSAPTPTIICGVIEHYIAARSELEAEGSPLAVVTTEVRGAPTKVFAAAPPHMRFFWELAAAHGDKDYLV